MLVKFVNDKMYNMLRVMIIEYRENLVSYKYSKSCFDTQIKSSSKIGISDNS